jgi:hypothetical protein
MPVTDQRDELDNWLERDVTPLYPSPGSFERIRRVARKRKRRQALLAAGCCAVLVAAGATAPQLASALSHGSGHSPPPLAQGSRPAEPQTTAPGNGGSEGPDSNAAKPIQREQRTTLSDSWTKPPPNFRPTSVTVVGTGNGGLVGAVIGQAGTPGHCATKDCTSLAGTGNYGQGWYGVSAPVAPGPAQPAGVSQLRFANTEDGWAYGPGLWETSAGGWPWSRVDTGGLRVTDLEAVGNRAFAIAASCSGSGVGVASGCTGFSVYTLTAGSTTWTPVAVPAAYRQMTTTVPSSATLVIAGGQTVYVLTPSGAVLSGPVSGDGLHVAGQAPAGCLPGRAQADGQPTGAQLTAGTKLLLACDTTTENGPQLTELYSSASGAQWTRVGPIAHQGDATSLTTAASGQAVLATTDGLYYLPDGGGTWQQASVAGPVGSFSYVGLTTPTDGVAVPGDAKLGEIFVTVDGGKAWTASPIQG